MKPFETYQFLAGEEMTDRDKTEVGSKFWNKGKWDNFVLPFLPEDCSGQTFVDVGCNAGLFLNLAEEKGFARVIGVDSNAGAIKRGMMWRDKHNKNYKLFQLRMEECLNHLPMADYTVLANAHYYFKIDDWIRYLDRLQYKTRHCIIVTTEKRRGNRCWTQADLLSIRSYFDMWEEVDSVEDVLPGGDPRPRRLWGLDFESPYIERVSIKYLDSGNHVQDRFYGELDSGKHYSKTKYYAIIRKYRLHDRKDWDEKRLELFFKNRVALYESIKMFGQLEPILINRDDLILDGNHRCQMLKHLGHETVFVREV